MSENQANDIQLCLVDVESSNQEITSKKSKIGLIVGLVPQRKNYLSDISFQQVMDEYIFHCRRLEMVKKLKDCLKRNGG